MAGAGGVCDDVLRLSIVLGATPKSDGRSRSWKETRNRTGQIYKIEGVEKRKGRTHNFADGDDTEKC